MQPIKPLTIELDNQIIIEASAGTGKTYATATIYLRLILGINTKDNKAYLPSEVLVVTFTEDAAEELRTRIFQRLSEAITLIQTGEPENELEIELLSEIASLEYPLETFESAEQFAIARLQSALIAMDESAIFTIHGFAHRVLTEYAFETNAPFEFDLITNTTEIRMEAASDFWRRYILTLPAHIQESVMRHLKSPTALAHQFIPVNSHVTVLYGNGMTVDDAVSLQDSNAQAIEKIKIAFEKAGGPNEMTNILLSLGLKGNVYSKKTLAGKMKELYDAAVEGVIGNRKDLELLMPDKFEASRNKTSTAQYHDLPGCNELLSFKDQYQEIDWEAVATSLKESANRYMNEYIGADKGRNSLLDFDDLLSLLEKALKAPGGERLANAIAKKYPVAAVDEFQDTDPSQYEIFSRIYDPAVPSAHALLMIGDPKQAIYAFRGGDIHTYLAAREKSIKQYTLDTNYRSHPDAVSAVNKLFAGVNLANGASKYDMTYQPVKADANGSKEFTIGDKRQSGLNFLSFDMPFSSESTCEFYLAEQCAAHISRLLSKGAEGLAKIAGEALSSKHIAVLVPKHAQGEKVVAALNKVGIDSVSRSRRSVFLTQTARDMLSLLQAIERPNNDFTVRSATCSQTLAYSQQELDELMSHDELWDDHVNALSDAKEALLTYGVAAAFQSVWDSFSIGKRLARATMAERTITNWRHIVELLQLKEHELPGSPELLQYFTQQVSKPDGSDEQEMRLESEENLIQIITLHKSKGLEYPVVFMPFSSLPSQARNNIYHDESEGSKKIIDISNSDIGEQAKSEHAAEQVRLFYVGVTRAKYTSYVYVANIDRGARVDLGSIEISQIGHVLGCTTFPDVLARLDDLNTNAEILHVKNPTIESIYYRPPASEKAMLSPRVFSGHIDRSWRIASYSSINKNYHENEYIQEDSIESKTGETLPENDPETLDQVIAHSFPAGAIAGQCLHDILENTVNNGPDSLPINVSLNLKRYGFNASFETDTTDWLGRVIQQKVCQGGHTIAGLNANTAVAEMQFHIATGKVSTTSLNEVLRDHPAHQRDLSFTDFEGLLTGYIDLTIVGTKAWILDYKSNKLVGYGHEQLSDAITSHRYYLQYLLYTVAMHRYLKHRWSGYEYDTHFGGVEYLFLRGMTGEEGSGIWFEKPNKELIERLDQLFSDNQKVAA